MKPIILLGSGGHARVLVDSISASLRSHIIGSLSRSPEAITAYSLPHLGNDSLLTEFPPASYDLINGVGTARCTSTRARLYEQAKAAGYELISVIHSKAVISDKAILAEGVQVLAGAIVQIGCRIDDNAIINSHAVIEHDCTLGKHCHVAPGAVLCGNVNIGAQSFIGAGAIIRQGVSIGECCVIAAGAVVLTDVESGDCVMGVPAKSKAKAQAAISK